MNKKAVFTICAKNYLAQAYTLRSSILRHNPDLDFYIFLSDSRTDLDKNIEDVIDLDDSWIPGWKTMAFKYNVIEFSTSIKPYCFKKLFSENYSRIIYLDPDIYVLNDLITIFDLLIDKSIVLTPHLLNIEKVYTGAVSEEEILFVGIYNLGFIALKNSNTTQLILEWWENRLENKCYADKHDSLHVDQRWIDFIPAFFPDDVKVLTNCGANVAIWNLHERELVFKENEYLVTNKLSSETTPLLFFHFSGFDVKNPNLINKRHPDYNTEVFPSFIPLFKEYSLELISNNVGYYSTLSYGFNSFSDGELILPIHRRLYRVANCHSKDPFSENSEFRLLLKNKSLLSKIKSSRFQTFTDEEKKGKRIVHLFIIKTFYIIKILFGIRYYSSLLLFIHEFTRFENQNHLIDNAKK